MTISLPMIHKIGIISVISIVTVAFVIFYTIQAITESSIRNNLMTDQIDRQQNITRSLSQHIGSDLTLVMTVLDGLANSINLQEGELYTEKTKSMIDEKYNLISDIIDRIFVLDKNDVVTIGLSRAGTDRYLGADFSQREWVIQAKNALKPVFSKGFERQDIYSVYIAVPIVNMKNGTYIGMIGASVPTEKFFSRYGNVYNINAQFLVAYDKDGTILAVGADRSLVGKNFFGDIVQNFVNHNPILNNLTTRLLKGESDFGIYDYGRSERINTGNPIYVQNKPVYFLSIITPAKVVLSKIGETLFAERLKSYSLLAASFASIAFLVVLLLKWNTSMEREVIKRTNELNKSNTKLDIMAKDLTDSNLSLQKLNDQLKQNDKLQREFIDMAAHELRTPIQPILGLADVLRDHVSDSHQLKLLDVIMRNARRLQRLTSDLLDVSKIENRLVNLSKSQFDLNIKITDVINDIYQSLDKEYESKKINIIFEPKEVITVIADKDRIYQVVSNLLNNAIKFTDNGTITVTANLNYINSKYKEAIVNITDSGKGIDPAVIPKLFSKFTTTSYTGTGLGLFISKGIVESHGGKIWARNNSNGRGACFSFSLPAV
ncbi:MAG TPA: sensor histidine kinase [Nitrososphaeraceae archaeon]